MTWDPVFGSTGYELEYILVGDEHWAQLFLVTNHYETYWVADGWEYRFRIRTTYGNTKTEWSDIISVVFARPGVITEE